MSDSVPPDWVEAANLHATVAQLLSTVIHQVNNALQTIGGHAELLKTDVGATDTTRRRANTITTVNERTAAMLASFQVFTRPPLGAEVYNLRDVAEQALAFRRYGLGRARIEATIEGVEQAPVRAELRPLMQAVLNVILNAEQALAGRAGENRIVITVGRDGEGTADERAWVSVDDNGPGSPADVSPSGGVSALALGRNNRLGLGLAAARQIVERLGGTLVLETAPAGGTRVRIALPASV